MIPIVLFLIQFVQTAPAPQAPAAPPACICSSQNIVDLNLTYLAVAPFGSSHVKVRASNPTDRPEIVIAPGEALSFGVHASMQNGPFDTAIIRIRDDAGLVYMRRWDGEDITCCPWEWCDGDSSHGGAAFRSESLSPGEYDVELRFRLCPGEPWVELHAGVAVQ